MTAETADTIKVVAACITTVCTPLSMLLLLLLRKQGADSHKQGEENHALMNSRMDQLLESTSGEAHAAGVVAGKEQEKAEHGE